MNVTFYNDKSEEFAVREIAESVQVDFNRLPVTEHDLLTAGKKITLQFFLPIRDMQGVFPPHSLSMAAPSMKLEWNYTSSTAQQKDIPCFTFFNLSQKNTATVALTCIHDDVQMSFKMDQMRCCYAVTVTVAVVPETEPFELLLSFAPEHWTQIRAAWRKIVLPELPVFPDDAYQPVYCTWYAVHGAITNEYLDRNAELAAELGFRTFIVDDGWSYDEMKRVCPEKLAEGWYRDIGNWTVSGKKLPDFKKHVEYAQSLGLKYLLWTAPFFAGVCSEEYKKWKDHDNEMVGGWDDVSFLLPEGNAAQHVIDLLKNLMTDYNLDGLKVDFLDYIPADVNSPHSRSCRRYFAKLSSAIRSVRPDALIEFRQSYATPQMLEFGTQFRAGDVPFDYMENLKRLAQIRVTLGDCVPCHADPVYFHPEEKTENIARHMIAALAGVPMLSMDLERLTPEQSDVIRFWLNFYREHLETFKTGHWEVYYFMDTVSRITVEKDGEVIVILTCPELTAPLIKEYQNSVLYLLNLSGSSLDAAETGSDVQAFGCAGEKVSGTAAPLGGLLRIG